MRRIAAVFAVLLVVLLLVLWRLHGPSPQPANAPPSDFSAARAIATLTELLGDQRPHPVGSAANAAVRDRIVARFRAEGYETRIQRRFVCNAHNVCATVENILAMAPGQPDGDTLVLASHYDSVSAGPGASDDGVGTAALLEVARAIRGRPFRNRILFLITDGEEAGLLGAEAFVADKTLSRNVAAIVNLEARGTGGPSYLFETSRRNRWLVGHAARALEQPITTSLFFSIYELLPNDTDLTVFKRAGIPGVNFAFIRNVIHYHTPNDNLANVEPRTVQHHGDNALAMARQLASADLRNRTTDDAVWFDVLGFFVIWWPAGWTLFVAVASFIGLIVAMSMLVRPGFATARAITFGVLSFFGSLLLAGLGGMAAGKIGGIASGGARWVTQPAMQIAAAWLIGLAMPLLLAALLRRKITFDSLFAGHAIVWHVLAIVVAIGLRGASYLFLVPAVVMTICALLRAKKRVRETPVAIVCALVTSILLFPFGVALYDALGGTVLGGVAVLIALVGTSFAPAMESWRIPVALAIASLLVAGLANLKSDAPRRMTFWHLTDDRGAAQWVSSSAMDGFERKTILPWFGARGQSFVSPAPAIAVTPPEVRGSRAGEVVTIDVRSTRGADRVTTAIEGDVDVLRVNGVAPAPRPPRFRSYVAPGWKRIAVRGGTATIELRARGGAINVVAVDATPGLPSAGGALVRAREARRAVASDEGDGVYAMRRVRL